MLSAGLAMAEPLRVATWHADFSRKGPGLMLHELLKTPLDITAFTAVAPDVLLLTDVDYDAGNVTLAELARQLGGYPFHVSVRPNRGRPTGVDIDGDGRLAEPEDAQGFGYFSGQGGMGIVSRYPLRLVRDDTAVLWRDVTGSYITKDDPAYEVQRLASSGFWAVEVLVPKGAMTLLTVTATPPVFDGPEDRNGRRNRDEVLYWPQQMQQGLIESPVVLLGNFNLDPENGDGLRQAVRDVLADPRWQDPLPGLPTVIWDQTGPMRVSYVLPDSSWKVVDAGVAPPIKGFGPHSLIWADLER